MKTRSMMMMLCGVAALACAQAANACEFTRTPWGLRVTGCKLYDLTGGRYDVSIDTRPDRPRIPWPNLHVTNIGETVVGVNVNLSAEIENNGDRDAGAFEVVLTVSTHNPLAKGASVGMTTLAPSPVPGLAIGAGATVFPGGIVLPNRTQDWDVCTIAVVDAPATGGPASGAVLESNESDNQLESCYRVFAAK